MRACCVRLARSGSRCDRARLHSNVEQARRARSGTLNGSWDKLHCCISQRSSPPPHRPRSLRSHLSSITSHTPSMSCPTRCSTRPGHGATRTRTSTARSGAWRPKCTPTNAGAVSLNGGLHGASLIVSVAAFASVALRSGCGVLDVLVFGRVGMMRFTTRKRRHRANPGSTSCCSRSLARVRRAECLCRCRCTCACSHSHERESVQLTFA